MSERGLCSRREADSYIERGWVRVDGEVVSELGARAFPDQVITLERAAQARQVAERLALVAGVTAEAAAGGWDVPLANLRIHVREDASALTPVLSTLTLENRDGAHYTLDTGV